MIVHASKFPFVQRMTISESRFGMNAVEQEVEILMPGVGITDCWECGGDGDWSKFHPEPETVPGLRCVDCKGTGKRYVDAWGFDEMRDFITDLANSEGK